MLAPATFSYADPDDPRLRRLTIRGIERLTGQRRLKRLYDGYRAAGSGHDFFNAAVDLLGFRLDYDPRTLAHLPETGPLVVVANHPFGVVDGLVIGHLVGLQRSDYKVIAHGVLTRAPEAAARILPMDFSPRETARAANVKVRRRAIAWLKDGGCVIVFPAGNISTAPKPLAKNAVDARWGTFTAKMIQAARAPVLPVYFSGQNSRLFQIASHISPALRLSLVFNEVKRKMGGTINVRIGELIPHATLAGIPDRQALMDYLCGRTYALGC